MIVSLMLHTRALYLLPAIACVFLTSPLVAQPAAPATQPAVKVTETPIYTIPNGVKIIDTLVSPDNLHMGVVESKDNSFTVVVDGVRGRVEEWVLRGTLLFSQEGGRFAYQVQKGNQMMVVVGQAGPQWSAQTQPAYYMVGRMVFSTDGKRFAYLAQKQKDGPMLVVVDGKEMPEADEVFAADLAFSSDGQHFAYRARKKAAQPDPANPRAGGKQFYVIDGAAQPEHDIVTRLTFSVQGGRWGYIARDGQESTMVVDGKASTKYAVVAGLAFSADGKRYAYAIETAGADGKPGGKQALIYNSGEGEKQFQAFDGIGAIVFSPDGRRLAITTQTGKKWSIYVDGKASGEYEGTGGLLFSPDNKRLAAVAGRDGRQFLVVDGKEYAPVDVVATAGFSPDSSKIASVVIIGAQRMLFLEDKRVGPATFFAFSPDSAWLGHALPAGEAKWQLGLDGKGVGQVYDAAPPGARVVWESPTVARIIAGRGSDMFLVKMTLGG